MHCMYICIFRERNRSDVMGMKTDISSADGMMEDGNHLFWIHPWETKNNWTWNLSFGVEHGYMGPGYYKKCHESWLAGLPSASQPPEVKSDSPAAWRSSRICDDSLRRFGRQTWALLGEVWSKMTEVVWKYYTNLNKLVAAFVLFA